MPNIKKLAAAPAMLAAFSITIMPAAAAELPQPVAPTASHVDAVPVFDPDKVQTAENHRYRRYRHYRHHRGPDAGDVIAGVLIIGAIAAVADRATRRDRDRDYRDRDYRDRNYRYDRPDDSRRDDGRGIDRAVRMCIDRVERDTRVETVDRVDRTARGWQVEGTIFNGEGFLCTIGEDGRIRDIEIGARGAGYDRDTDNVDYEDDFARAEVDDRQWEDDRYAAERDRIDRGAATGSRKGRPAYPGGPVEGEEEVEGDLEIGTGYPGA